LCSSRPIDVEIQVSFDGVEAVIEITGGKWPRKAEDATCFVGLRTTGN
jgi:hypothetical protein